MIRPITCIAFLLACGSGLYLYQTKHRVKLLDDHIAQVIKSTDALHEQTRMLNAEWTLLNDPERLRQLANQFLTLQTVAPTQFTSLANLDSRLPPPAPITAPDAAGPPALPATVPMADATMPDNASHAAEAGKVPDTSVPNARVPGAKLPAASVPDTRLAAAPAKDATPARLADAAATDALHATDRHVPPRAPAPTHLASTDQPRPAVQHIPDQHDADRRLANQRDLDRRAAEQRAAALRRPSPPAYAAPVRPIVASQMVPPSSGGSLLGMAHSMAAPPAPMPLPRPMPVSAPSWMSGGTGG